jgi:hypothetical protein
MLRNFAVALLAATVLTAPALAQGMKTDTKTPAAATTTTAPKADAKTDRKTVAAKPTHTAGMHKHHRHVAHLKHGKHVAHVKHGKHVKYVKAAPSTDGAKHHVRHVAKKPAGTTGAAAANSAKPKSGTN